MHVYSVYEYRVLCGIYNVICSMFSMGHIVVKMLGNGLSNLCVVICNVHVCTVI